MQIYLHTDLTFVQHPLAATLLTLREVVGERRHKTFLCSAGGVDPCSVCLEKQTILP